MATASAQRRRRERPSRVALFKACRSAQLQVAYIYSSTEGAALHGAVLPSTSAQQHKSRQAAPLLEKHREREESEGSAVARG